MAVMMPVYRRPPERTALYRRVAPDGDNELSNSGRPESSMREIPMVKARNREHPEHIENCGNCHRSPAPAYPDHADAAQVQKEEWKAAAILKSFGSSTN